MKCRERHNPFTQLGKDLFACHLYQAYLSIGSPPVAHTDGAQITPVGRDVSFIHNTIYSNDGTSAIITPLASTGIVTNVLIKDNLLAGGAYTLYCQQSGSGNDYRVIGNHFSTIFYPKVGAYGPWTDCEDETEVSGNVYHETGEPLTSF